MGWQLQGRIQQRVGSLHLCDIYFHHVLMHDVEEMNLCLLGLLGDLVTTLFFTESGCCFFAG